MSCRKGPPHVDRAIGDLAATQEGIVTAAQLAGLGLGRGAVEHRVLRGLLRQVHPNVFAVGHPRLTLRGRWLAAVWACGPRAALSHRDAAALHGIRPSSRSTIDVSTPDRGRKGHAGIQVHRVRRLHPDDVTTAGLIPVTTVARTIVDLAEVTRRDGVARAWHEADVRRALDVTAVAAAVGRVTGRRSLRPVVELIEAAHDAVDGGELARRFLVLCRRAGLPEPVVGGHIEVNGRSWEVDFSWPARRVCVETDGGAVHRTRRAFETDRVRDGDFLVSGWRVLRLTWRRIRDEPDVVADLVRRLLDAPVPEGGPFGA
jgi:hypothetical protein